MAFHWMVLYGLIVLIVLAKVYGKRALRHVTYERHFSREAAFEGETIEMVERIANRKLLPVPWLQLESVLSRHLVFGRQENFGVSRGELFQHHISLFSLRPYRRIVRRHQVRLAKRGWYRLESVTMTAGDPFGLVRAARKFPVSLTLLVYPRAVPLYELPLPNHGWLGELPVRRWIVEDPFLASGVREYQFGDPPNAVHWKATARTGRLQVHRREPTADHRLVICLNVEVTETMWKTVTDPERIEEGIRYAASVAEYALRHGIETGFLCNGWRGRRRPGAGLYSAGERHVASDRPSGSDGQTGTGNNGPHGPAAGTGSDAKRRLPRFSAHHLPPGRSIAAGRRAGGIPRPRSRMDVHSGTKRGSGPCAGPSVGPRTDPNADPYPERSAPLWRPAPAGTAA